MRAEFPHLLDNPPTRSASAAFYLGLGGLARLVRVLALLFLTGCSRSDQATLPEWTAADHDHQSTASTGQVDTSKKRPGMPGLEKQGVTDVILVTWKQNCIKCHGVVGRGDGPEGPIHRPPDMTDPSWHSEAKDEVMRRIIREGQGKMPAFGQLPEGTVVGLVQLIRLLNRDRGRADASPPAPTDSAAVTPAPSTTPRLSIP